MKKGYTIFIEIFGFLTGSLVNIILGVLLVVLIFSYTRQAFEKGKEITSEKAMTTASHAIEVVIPDDAKALEIAGILEDKGLIANKYFYYFQAFLKKKTDDFQPGSYTLNTNMTTAEITSALTPALIQDTTVAEDIKITIPEGYTIKQIAELLESKELFSASDFLEACEDRDNYNYEFLDDIKDRENYLEGYLFPDTYFLSSAPTPDEVITKMLNRFDDIFSYELRDQADELGISIDDAVIMASIIEKEINRTEERELASAVIYNRIDDNMPLQMCSTVMYVLDKRKDRLLETDLQIESPYNTYINSGLPVGPIANPGKASILAALNPASNSNLYFVLKDEETGEHFFTDSYNEFLAAKDRYNQKF